MDTFGFIVKSYKHDFLRVQALSKSFLEFCTDNSKLYIIVPDNEFPVFSSLVSDNIILLAESSIPVTLTEVDINGVRPGYINQELIKLSFWKTELVKNYLCLDSDGVFIRNFSKNDFMYSDTEPFTVMIDDKDLMSQPSYRDTWNSREKSIRKIYDILELPQPRYIRTTHGFQVLSHEVLHHMENNFQRPLNLSYLDLLKISPYEFSWYTIYLLKMKKDIRQTEPFFKYYHDSNQYISDLILGVTKENLLRGYVGLVVNSNFQPGNKVINLDTNKITVLSYYLSFSELSKAIFLKIKFVIPHAKIMVYRFIKNSKSPTRSRFKSARKP